MITEISVNNDELDIVAKYKATEERNSIYTMRVLYSYHM